MSSRPRAQLEDALAVALEPDGLVKDAASRDLAQARRDVREVREELVKRLGGILAGLDARLVPPDASATVRGGRYVIPVRREARSRLGGIVHDESATHATLFVEPAEAIEMGNRLREAEAAEAREALRVLRELTDRLRPHADTHRGGARNARRGGLLRGARLLRGRRGRRPAGRGGMRRRRRWPS